MKTILKLYDNGDFETVDTALVQSGITGNYSFGENSITVPKIIEHPPPDYRNYFIEELSESGWVTGNAVQLPNEDDRCSHHIDVRGWESLTVRIRFYNADGSHSSWVSVATYNEAKGSIGILYDNYASGGDSFWGNYDWQYKAPVGNFSFIRISTTYYDTPGVTVKVSVERGDTNNTKHYLAPEDMPEWVVDTGNPISIFPEGIVIKGSLYD